MLVLNIPDYTLLDKLYEGKHSLVYKAYHNETKQNVVVKLLKNDYPSPQQIGRFQHEYEITKNLHQLLPNQIIKPLDLIKIQNTYAMVLEDFGAYSLDKFIIEKPFTIAKFLTIALTLVEILSKIHAHNILHKDINPTNILINPQTSLVKFIDFGISSSLSFEWFELQSVNSIEGTLSYISPEQTGRMNRVLDYRSDYYSLGITLYEMLVGRPPFQGLDPMELVYAHLAKKPKPPSEVNPLIPSALSDIVMKLISKTPEERYQSSYGLLTDLKECQTQYFEKKNILPFPLAKKDISTRFQISEKLYGRETEINILLNSFQEASQGKTCFTLISGYAGIGKSALVNEIHKAIAEHKGYYTSGKCDQYRRNVPYESLIQALQKIIQQILTEPPERLAKWKLTLQKAVGDQGKIVTNLIPHAKLLLGNPPELENVEYNEAKIRFRMVFQNFIQALAIDGHPVTLFFDDIQWIDYATLELIVHLLTDPNSHHLFIIGAYRSNEIDENHPLHNALETFQKQNVEFNKIEVQPLQLQHVCLLLSETLHCEINAIKPLAELCYSKTQGNPFFLTRLLLSLYEEKQIAMNISAGVWTWDIEKIKKKEITDNVVEFMSNKILELSPTTQEFLQIAACIGNTFDLKILASITENPIKQTSQNLWEATKEGLLIPENENYKYLDDEMEISIPFRFLHDRVQQAVYTLIPEKRKKELHYKIAKFSLKNNKPAEIEENLFEIVNHYNQGASCIDNEKENTELSILNLKAGLKALDSSAFETAVSYLKNSKRLLPKNAWEEMYDTTLQLHKEYSQSLYFISEHEQAISISQEALNHAKTSLQKAEIMSMQEIYLTDAGKIEESIEIGLAGLQTLGINFKKNISKLQVVKEFLIAKWNLRNRKVSELIHLPKITDPKIKLITKLMDNMDASAWFTRNRNLVAIMALKRINLILKYGVSDSACNSFLTYTVMLTMAGDLATAKEYAHLTLKFAEKTESKHYKARVLSLYGHMVGGWHEHWKNLKIYLNEAAQLSQLTGDILTYSLGATFSRIWDPEIPQDQVAKQGKKISAMLKQTRSPQGFYAAKMNFQMRASLCGQTKSPFVLDDEIYNEEECIQHLIEMKLDTGLAMAYHNRAILHYHFNDYEKSLEYLKKLDTLATSQEGGNFHIEYMYYSFYIHSAMFPKLTKSEQKASMKLMKKQHQWFLKLSEHCPENFSHHVSLMEAELAKHQGNREVAAHSYDQAVKKARANEYIRFEALANELAAIFYLDWGLENIAKIYFHDARYCYQKWGASAKVKLMEETYPHLLPAIRSPSSYKDSTTTSTSITTEKTSSEILDFISVMKASQAITREIQLQKLIEKMMHIVIENAGAEKGYLLLEKNGHFFVEAIAKDEQVKILPSLEIQELPKSIINAVSFTKEPVVIDNAIQDDRFKNDPYIVQFKSKSILCFPLMNLGVIKGMLYLENNLARGIFTQERLDVINMLSTQMAISIDNARFYGQLEQKVQERTRELKEAQNQLIQKEKMAFLGMLTTGVGHEMKNPLNFIINFSKFSNDLIKDLIVLFKDNSEKKVKEIPSIFESLDTLKENTESTYHQGIKADTIVNRMIEHSAITGQQFVPTDIHHLLEQSLSINQKKSMDQYKDLKVVVKTNLDPNMPLIRVADADLQRVFLNLLDNAFYSLHEKQQEKSHLFLPIITISTKIKNGYCEISIKDNGQGIPPQYFEKIFTPFFTTRPTGQGVGLGLSLCHNIIVKEHNGSLSFETKLGEFTEFIIKLPFHDIEN